MSDVEYGPEDRRWRSAGTFQQFLDHMEEFRWSPEGRKLQADRQAAEADLQVWLVDQTGVVISRHGGQVPERWEGQVDGRSFYFRERGGEWDIELDLQQGRPSTASRMCIATGTIADAGYGESLRERAAFIVTTIRKYPQRSGIANVARGERIFRVEYSPVDDEFVGLVAEFPSLSWLAPTEDEALRGIVRLVEQVVADDEHDTGDGG